MPSDNDYTDNNNGEAEFSTITKQGKEVIVGGEKVSAKDDYLKTVTNIFYKINAAADNKNSMKELLWSLEYYTDILINSILNPEDRDNFRVAKEDILQIELLKRSPKPVRTAAELQAAVDEELKDQALTATCMIIIGEIKNYLDKYYGIETKLAVML